MILNAVQYCSVFFFLLSFGLRCRIIQLGCRIALPYIYCYYIVIRCILNWLEEVWDYNYRRLTIIRRGVTATYTILVLSNDNQKKNITKSNTNMTLFIDNTSHVNFRMKTNKFICICINKSNKNKIRHAAAWKRPATTPSWGPSGGRKATPRC